MEAERENPEVGGHGCGNSDGEREAWRIIVTGTLRPEILPTTVATICRRSIYTFSFSFFPFFFCVFNALALFGYHSCHD